jgi:hypothetical protein
LHYIPYQERRQNLYKQIASRIFPSKNYLKQYYIMEEVMSENKDVQGSGGEEREFSASSSSAIFDAPLSWVALFGALIAVGSLVPVIVYPGGGGYSSLSNTVLFVLTGFVLGPWAGGIAGIIGGLIGMFIAPAAFPLGFVDVFLVAGLQAMLGGLIAMKWKKYMFVWWIINFAILVIFPYRWPGPSQGFENPPEPAYLASLWWVVLGFVFWLAWAYTPFGDWVKKGGKGYQQVLGLIVGTYAGLTAFYGPYGNTFYYVLKYPIERAITENHLTAPLFFITAIAQGIVAMVVFRALWRTGLRKVPGSLLEETS